MAQRRANAAGIGFVSLAENERDPKYSYGDLSRFPVYFGTHPQVMEGRIAAHPLSREDKKSIDCKYWWFPAKWLRTRYKTGRRVKERIV